MNTAAALTALRATATAARDAKGVDEYCQAVVGHMAELLGVERCSIVLLRAGFFHHAAAVGLDEHYCDSIDGLEVLPDLGSCGPAILTGHTTITPDLAASPNWAPVRELLERYDLRACWSVPLRAGCDPALGSLGIYPDTVGEPSREQLALAETLADILALAIDGLQRQQALAQSHQASMQALMAALDARDAYTAGHSEATTDLALRVGERLGLGLGDLSVLERAAALHDIGKLAIPDSVLHFPHALDPEQRSIMRAHPVVGAEIVGHVPGMEDVALAVRHEHERWDGDGYPDGLAGEAIPIVSRIVFACDAFHAMTSDRPYRDAMAEQAAIAELREHRGTQFDPAVVDALLAELGV